MLVVVATPTDFLQPSQGSGDKTCPREQACWPSAGQSHKAGTNDKSPISSSSHYFLDFFSPFLQLQLSTKLDKKDKLFVDNQDVWTIFCLSKIFWIEDGGTTYSILLLDQG